MKHSKFIRINECNYVDCVQCVRNVCAVCVQCVCSVCVCADVQCVQCVCSVWTVVDCCGVTWSVRWCFINSNLITYPEVAKYFKCLVSCVSD